MSNIIEIASGVGPAPCDDCGHAQKCGSERLACEVYGVWVNTGKIKDLPREPTRAGYNEVYYGPQIDWSELPKNPRSKPSRKNAA